MDSHETSSSWEDQLLISPSSQKISEVESITHLMHLHDKKKFVKIHESQEKATLYIEILLL